MSNEQLELLLLVKSATHANFIRMLANAINDSAAPNDDVISLDKELSSLLS